MATARFSRPDVLVLAAGGVLGEAWMTGLLAGIEDAAGIDFRRCEHYVGTSAGSIVAARLASGHSPRGPDEETPEDELPAEPMASGLARAAHYARRVASAWALAATAPLAPIALAASAPGGALMRAALLARIPRPKATLDDLRHRAEREGARFDGRLRIACVDRRRGRRVVFGSPGAPGATVGEAVEASCAVPWLFAPVTIGGREYVDGGVWSPTNLDVAPVGRGTEVLCLNPTASVVSARSLFGAARAVASSAAAVESLALRRRGATVRLVGPDGEAAAAMGSDFMASEPARHVLVAAFRQGRALAAA